MQQCIHRW
jgi:hypothetical protein